MCIPFTHRWVIIEITRNAVLSKCRDCPKTKLRVKNWG